MIGIFVWHRVLVPSESESDLLEPKLQSPGGTSKRWVNYPTPLYAPIDNLSLSIPFADSLHHLNQNIHNHATGIFLHMDSCIDQG